MSKTFPGAAGELSRWSLCHIQSGGLQEQLIGVAENQRALVDRCRRDKPKSSLVREARVLMVNANWGHGIHHPHVLCV